MPEAKKKKKNTHTNKKTPPQSKINPTVGDFSSSVQGEGEGNWLHRSSLTAFQKKK